MDLRDILKDLRAMERNIAQQLTDFTEKYDLDVASMKLERLDVGDVTGEEGKRLYKVTIKAEI